MWLICRRRVIAEVYPCHGTCPVKPELIGQLYEAAGDVLAGKVQGKAAEMPGKC